MLHRLDEGSASGETAPLRRPERAGRCRAASSRPHPRRADQPLPPKLDGARAAERHFDPPAKGKEPAEDPLYYEFVIDLSRRGGMRSSALQLSARGALLLGPGKRCAGIGG
jgi:hypothetical protein